MSKQTYSSAEQKCSYAVLHNASGEACLKASGGSIVVDDFYEDIEFSLNKSNVNNTGSDTQRTITVTAKQNGSALTVGSGTNQISYTFSLTYHGETVPSNYYETNSSLSSLALNQIRLGSNLPAGDYVLYATGVYNGKSYSSSFTLTLGEYIITSENISSLTLDAGGSYNFVLSSDCTSANFKTLINLIKTSSIGKSTIDLSHTSMTSFGEWIPAKITSVTLPSAFNRVGSQDFQEANDLEEINISDDNPYFTVIDGVIYDKNLTAIIKYPAAKTGDILNLPDTVTTIKMQAFKNNKNLVTINGLDRITSIRSDSGHSIFSSSQKLDVVDFSSVMDDQLPYYAFNSSSVRIVTLSPSITKIGTGNFNSCSRLTEVHFKTSEPPVLCANEIGTISNEKVFNNSNTDLRIYVPRGSKAAYLADTTREGGFANPGYNGLASRTDFSDLIIEE